MDVTVTDGGEGTNWISLDGYICKVQPGALPQQENPKEDPKEQYAEQINKELARTRISNKN